MVGWTANDVDLAEIDEASAACAIAWCDQCGFDPSHVNAHGGDIDFGRPAVAPGLRHLVTLLHAMARRGAHNGIVVTCLGDGAAIAMAVERAPSR